MGVPGNLLKSLIGGKRSVKVVVGGKEQKVPAKPRKSKISLRFAAKAKRKHVSHCEFSQEAAAVHIQSAFRGFLARKEKHAMKGSVRLQAMIRGESVLKQALTTLHSVQVLGRVHAQVHAQRLHTSREAQAAQKQLQESRKIESPQHLDPEEAWCDGIGTKEEIYARVQQRQIAAAKRERALAYAFSNQWRPNTRRNFIVRGFNKDFTKDSWSWTWLEWWVLDLKQSNGLEINDIRKIATHDKNVGIQKLSSDAKRLKPSKVESNIPDTNPCIQSNSQDSPEISAMDGNSLVLVKTNSLSKSNGELIETQENLPTINATSSTHDDILLPGSDLNASHNKSFFRSISKPLNLASWKALVAPLK